MVEALVRGDDSTNDSDCRLRLEVIYASAQTRASHEIFDPIQWDTDIFAEAHSNELELPAYAVEGW